MKYIYIFLNITTVGIELGLLGPKGLMAKLALTLLGPGFYILFYNQNAFYS